MSPDDGLLILTVIVGIALALVWGFRHARGVSGDSLDVTGLVASAWLTLAVFLAISAVSGRVAGWASVVLAAVFAAVLLGQVAFLNYHNSWHLRLFGRTPGAGRRN